MNLRIKIIYISIPFWVLLMFSCNKEEEVVASFTDSRDGQAYRQAVVGGTTWMAEDLRYGTPPYSYQQSLSVCPEGWSLPSRDDWTDLALNYGGYQDYENEVGDASKAHQGLKPGGTSGLNINGYYWASDPAWKDIPYIRSTTFVVHEDESKAALGAVRIDARFNCRCVKREKEISNGSFIEVNVNEISERYAFFPTHFSEDFYALFPEVEGEWLNLFLYKQPLEANEVLNRIGISIRIDVINNHRPFITKNFSIDIQRRKDDIYKTTSLNTFSENYEMMVTSFDQEKIEGTFSGTSSETENETVEGSFMILLQKD